MIGIFYLCFNNSSSAQSISNSSSTYKSIPEYLSSTLENIELSDSCLAGLFFVEFSLNRKKEVLNFTCSDDMPQIARLAIKQKLDSLKINVSDEHLDKISKKRKLIIIPIFINIDNNCKTSANTYINNMNPDSSGTLRFENNLLRASLLECTKKIISVQNSFLKSMESVGNANGYTDCFLLAPCLLIKGTRNKMKL